MLRFSFFFTVSANDTSHSPETHRADHVTRKLELGSLGVFYGGLEGLKGPAKMVAASEGDGGRQVFSALELEHCGVPQESDVPFAFDEDDPTYGSTTPRLEWEIVCGSEATHTANISSYVDACLPSSANAPVSRP